MRLQGSALRVTFQLRWQRRTHIPRQSGCSCFSLELPRNHSSIGHWLPTVRNIFHSSSSLDLELELELREGRMGAGVCPWYVWPHGAGSSGTGNLWFMPLQPVSQRLSVWTSPLFPHSNLNHLFLFCRGLKEKLFWSKKGQDNLVHYQTDKSLLYETVGGFSAQVHILSLLHLSTWLQCNWEGDYLKPLPETEYLFLFELLGVILFISGLYLEMNTNSILTHSRACWTENIPIWFIKEGLVNWLDRQTLKLWASPANYTTCTDSAAYIAKRLTDCQDASVLQIQ